jgi:outer membrane lipoprotein-sorting protein
MNRRSLILSPIALLALSPRRAAAAPVPLDRLSDYINSLRTAEARFTQVNFDGTRSKGRLYIRRPNRMRFEYDPPDQTLVLASAGNVAIFDEKSNSPPERYPLRRTPLNLILGNRVNLARAGMVTGHGEEGGMTTVTAQDPENPEYGSITLYFSSAPVALREWLITDEAGQETRVILDDLVTGKDYPGTLFDITTELGRRGLD